MTGRPRFYEPPEDPANTVFDPHDETFGPIMAALQAGEFEEALWRVQQLEDTLSISFQSQASDGFPDRVSEMRGWYVRLTPQEGEPFDAHILGHGLDEEPWHDAVKYLEVDPGSGEPLEGATPKVVRVVDILVY